MEISVYKKLMESEEERLGIATGREQRLIDDNDQFLAQILQIVALERRRVRERRLTSVGLELKARSFQNSQ